MKRAFHKPHILQPYLTACVGNIAIPNDDIPHPCVIKPYCCISAIDDEKSEFAAFGLRVAQLLQTCCLVPTGVAARVGDLEGLLIAF